VARPVNSIVCETTSELEFALRLSAPGVVPYCTNESEGSSVSQVIEALPLPPGVATTFEMVGAIVSAPVWNAKVTSLRSGVTVASLVESAAWYWI